MKRRAKDKSPESLRHETLFRALMDAAPYIIHFKDRDGRYVAVNEAFAALVGLPREKILGKTIMDLPRIKTEFAEKVIEIDRKVRRTGKSVQTTSRPPVARQDDTVVHIFKFPVFDANGEFDGVGTIDIDVTEHTRTEEELRETSHRLALSQRQAKIGYWRRSFKDENLTYISSAAEKILCYPTEGSPPKNDKLHAPIHPDDRHLVQSEYEAANAAQRDYAIEYRVVHGDGKIAHIFEVGEIEYDKNGKPVAHVGFVQDITALKTAEETASRLVAAIHNLSEGMALYDHQDRLVFANRVFWEHNPAIVGIVKPGMTYEQQLHHMIEKGSFPEAAGREEQWIKERLEQHGKAGDPVEIVRESGIVLQILETRLPDGGIAVLATDVSRYKKIEAELSAAKEEAEVANRAKT